MNVFFVDLDPELAAQSLCDAHVVKMILESYELLAINDYMNQIHEPLLRLCKDKDESCKQFVKHYGKHPERIALSISEVNRMWLIFHLHGLINEFQYRFQHEHKTGVLAQHFYSVSIPQINFCLNTPTFPLAMIPECKLSEDQDSIPFRVLSYRKYYQHKAKVLPRFIYTKRTPPIWL